MISNKLQIRILNIIIYLICIGYFAFSAILQDYGYVKYLKEILMIFILIVVFSKMKIIKIDLIDLSMLMFIGMLMVSYVALTENKIPTLYIIRCYVEPFAIYFISKNIMWGSEEIKYFITKIFNFTFWLSLYGIFQAYVLKDVFLINIGYPTLNGKLTYPYYISGFGRLQRVVSTFINPNTFAFFLGVIILIIYINKNLFESVKNKNFKIIIIISAFFLTFSRSNIIPFFICVIVYNICNNKNLRTNKKNMLIAIIFILTIILLFKYLLNIDIIDYFVKFINNTITLEDTSAAGRPQIWRSAFNRFKENIFGIGLGKTGSKSLYIGNEMLEPCESSYFSLLLDTGIQGFISYIFIFISIIHIFRKYKNRVQGTNLKNINKSLFYITLYVFIAFAFSNYVLDFEIMSIYYCMVGILIKNLRISATSPKFVKDTTMKKTLIADRAEMQ